MTFVELALTTAKMFGQEGELVLHRARGSYAPYKIRNRTGCSVHVWADADGSTIAQDNIMTEIPHDKTVDWRFDDWKTTREVGAFEPCKYLSVLTLVARVFHDEQQYRFAVCW